MRLGITANSEVPEAIRASRKVLSNLKGHDIVMERGIAHLFGKEGLPVEEMDIDILITVGGDGTILRSLQRTDAPIFGVNAGVLGFLAEVNENEISTGIRRLLDGDYFIEERIKLRTEVGGKRLFDATNEAVVHTAHIAKIRHFHVYVDDQLAMDVRADGIITATPTGSTCCHGPWKPSIIDPVPMPIIAPMAPFKFAARPLVVPASNRIRVELAKPKPACALSMGNRRRSWMATRRPASG